MCVLIFEGIATSGKSTVIEGLVEAFVGKKVGIADESITHEPIMERRDEAHKEFFNNVVNEWLRKDLDVLIFDRLYMTQAFRADTDLAPYGAVEALLTSHGAKTIFLKVAEEAIADRVRLAMAHRPKEWAEYLATKGDDVDNIAQTYIDQQRSQLELLQESRLPYEIFDTTNHDYQSVIRQLSE